MRVNLITIGMKMCSKSMGFTRLGTVRVSSLITIGM